MPRESESYDTLDYNSFRDLLMVPLPRGVPPRVVHSYSACVILSVIEFFLPNTLFLPSTELFSVTRLFLLKCRESKFRRKRLEVDGILLTSTATLFLFFLTWYSTGSFLVAQFVTTNSG